jgi:hypothetical protein
MVICQERDLPMIFILPFRYILDRPGGFLNLLLIMVCHFIPVVGRIVVLGYRAEVAVALERDPEMRQHPKFDFNRFAEYLGRGVWPFLIDLLLRLPQFFLILAFYIVTIIIILQGANNLLVLMFLGFELGFVLAELLHVIMSVPMQFHAEITGRFDLRGAFRFANSFWKRVGLVAIGTGFVYAFCSFWVLVVGFLFCFVGVYPAIALVEMAGQHLMVQLYRVYLSRGGEPLEKYRSRHALDRDEEFDDDREEEWEDEYADEAEEERRWRSRREHGGPD